MSETLTWKCDDTEPFEGGASAGDWQVGDDISVRFSPVQQPDDGEYAFITEVWFAESLNPATGWQDESEPEEFSVTCRTEYIVCTDPEDIGGTEVWSDYDYEHNADVLVYDTAEQALEAARIHARNSVADNARHYVWDGRSVLSAGMHVSAG